MPNDAAQIVVLDGYTLNPGDLSWAGIEALGPDVLTTEPPPPDHPLIGVQGCQITPHIAWASHRARQRLLQIAVDNVATFLAGRPQNVVNL